MKRSAHYGPGLWVKGGCGRSADGAAGVPPASEITLLFEDLRFVPAPEILVRSSTDASCTRVAIEVPSSGPKPSSGEPKRRCEILARFEVRGLYDFLASLLVSSATVTRRRYLTALVLVVTTLSAAAAVPWLMYWIGLSEIDGRPTPITHAVTAEQIDGLFKRLRISQPAKLDPISPYSYFLQGPRPGASSRIAWVIASSHNVRHLSDRRYWHLSGAALTIWLTRNWTPTELIASAIELEKPRAASAVPQ